MLTLANATLHPSGDAELSPADRSITQTLKAALALLDMRCMDHFIVAGKQMVSTSQRGLISRLWCTDGVARVPTH
jgi:DNA repair protein RadC